MRLTQLFQSMLSSVHSQSKFHHIASVLLNNSQPLLVAPTPRNLHNVATRAHAQLHSLPLSKQQHRVKPLRTHPCFFESYPHPYNTSPSSGHSSPDTSSKTAISTPQGPPCLSRTRRRYQQVHAGLSPGMGGDALAKHNGAQGSSVYAAQPAQGHGAPQQHAPQLSQPSLSPQRQAASELLPRHQPLPQTAAGQSRVRTGKQMDKWEQQQKASEAFWASSLWDGVYPQPQDLDCIAQAQPPVHSRQVGARSQAAASQQQFMFFLDAHGQGGNGARTKGRLSGGAQGAGEAVAASVLGYEITRTKEAFSGSIPHDNHGSSFSGDRTTTSTQGGGDFDADNVPRMNHGRTDTGSKEYRDSRNTAGDLSGPAAPSMLPPVKGKRSREPKSSVGEGGAARCQELRADEAQLQQGQPQRHEAHEQEVQQQEDLHSAAAGGEGPTGGGWAEPVGVDFDTAAPKKGGRTGRKQGAKSYEAPAASKLVWFPAVRVLSNAAEGVLEILRDSEQDPFQSFEELQDFMGLQDNTLMDHLLELSSHGHVDTAYLLQLCSIAAGDQQGFSSQPCLTYTDIRKALEAADGPGVNKKRTQALNALSIQHEGAVATLGEAKVDLQVRLVQKIMLEEQQQQLLLDQQQQLQANSMGVPDPSAVCHIVGLRPVIGRRVAAYLEGLSLQQLRAFPPSRKRPLSANTVEESLLDAIKAGVALPVDRLAQDFKFEGGSEGLSIEDVQAAVEAHLAEAGYMNGFAGYMSARENLLASNLESKVYKQEAKHGDDVTLKQIRLVGYLLKLQQAKQRALQQ